MKASANIFCANTSSVTASPCHLPLKGKALIAEIIRIGDGNMDEQAKARKCALCLIDKLHNLSLHALTLCGFGALICLAVNIITALAMFVSSRKQK